MHDSYTEAINLFDYLFEDKQLLGNTKNRLTIRNLCDILLFGDIALQDAKYGNAESGYMKRISL